MSILSLTLLGHFHASIDDQPVAGFRTNKVQALLIYLVAEPHPHSRESIMDLLWPNMPLHSARHNLRQVLYYLRGAISEVQSRRDGNKTKVPLVLTDRRKIHLNPDAGVTTDLHQFQSLHERTQQHKHPDLLLCAACRQDLEDVAALYQGDFLADFFLADSNPFEAWAMARRAALQRQYLDTLGKLGRIYLAHSQYTAAEEVARKQIAVDDFREEAQQQLLEVLARTGRRNEAFAHYDAFRQRLWDELGVAPEATTVELVEQIERGKLRESPVSAENETVLAQDTQDKQLEPLPQFLMEDAAPVEAPTTFVARERELSQLQAALDSARDGRGQVIFVVGGAGRGKTTLIREFARRAQAGDPDLVIVTGYCKAIVGIGDPYLPFREALTMLTGEVEARWAGGLIGQEHARQLWELMPITVPALVKHAPDLINRFVPSDALQERAAKAVPNDSALLNQIVTQVATRQGVPLDQTAIFAQYAAVLKAVANQRPLLLIIEDLHWVDAASSALFFHLSSELGDSQIVLLGTYRPEEVALDRSGTSRPGLQAQHPMADIVSELKRQYGDVWIDLGDVAGIEGRHFVEAYLDAQPNRLDDEFRQALFQRTEGHALFTVELLRAMQERGDLLQDEDGTWIKGERIDWTTLPVKVEGVIERRIKRLPESLQSILTAASIEGETFTAEVVARVQQLDDRTLVQQLSRELDKHHRLVTARAIEWLVPGRQRLSLYRFQHQLFQHYLYHRLDEVERGYLHEAVGNVLEELYEGRTRVVAGQLAHHFQEAGLVAKAIHYLTEAGDAAAAVHANIEAAAHYGRAVELAEQEEISTGELAHLYVSLGGQLMVTKGDGSPEVGQAYGRALELYGPAGESPGRFAALRGLALYHKLRGESARARQLSEEMLTLANSLSDPVLIVEACYAMGSHFFYSGDLQQAQAYLEKGINSYDRRQHRSLVSLYGQDPGVANLCYACLTLWLLGYSDGALERSTEALALAQQLAHPYSLAMAYTWSAWLHFYRGESQAVLERTKAAISLSTKHNFTIFLGVGTLLRGWALVGQGEVEEGISQVQQGMATAVLAIGSADPRTEWPAVLADSYRKLGQLERALGVLTKALAITEQSPNLEWGQPEIYRHKGEVLLLHEGHAANAEAEACFRQAIDVARRQGAKSLELRAIMSLSRLWQSQGKTEEARKMLGEIYGRFTEGFDTIDLQEAKALLQELS